jgi:hypothetical protein
MVTNTYVLTASESDEMGGATHVINTKLVAPDSKDQAAICVLIDGSASMGNYAVLICRFMAKYVEKDLPLGSAFVMVIFGDKPELVLSTKALTEDQRSSTCARLNAFEESDLAYCTNLSAGLDMAVDEMRKISSKPNDDDFELVDADGSSPPTSTSLVLLLDGCVNQGECRPEHLLAKAMRFESVVNIMFGVHASHEFSNCVNKALPNGKSYFTDPNMKDELALDLNARLKEARCANQAAEFKVGSFVKEIDPSTLYDGNSYFVKDSVFVDKDGKTLSLDEVVVDTGVYGKVPLSSTLVESRSSTDDDFVKMAMMTEKLRIRLNDLCNKVTSNEASADADAAEVATGEADDIISALSALRTEDSEPCYRSLSCVIKEQAVNIRRAVSSPRSVVSEPDDAPVTYRSLSANVGSKRPHEEDDQNGCYRSLSTNPRAPASSPTPSMSPVLNPHRMVSIRDV